MYEVGEGYALCEVITFMFSSLLGNWHTEEGRKDSDSLKSFYQIKIHILLLDPHWIIRDPGLIDQEDSLFVY